MQVHDISLERGGSTQIATCCCHVLKTLAEESALSDFVRVRVDMNGIVKDKYVYLGNDNEVAVSSNCHLD